MRIALSLRKLGVLNLLIAATIAVCSFKATPADAMTFQQVSGPVECAKRDCILASGLVDGQTQGAFRELVRSRHIAPGALVILDSEGGVLLYALRVGEDIRKAGFSTVVGGVDGLSGEIRPAECASACAFMFLGGVERAVAIGSKVGVHQIYANLQARDGLSVGDVQYLTSLCAMHIDSMGGGVGILVEALRTPPQGVHWFSTEELSRLAVVTPRRSNLTLASN